MKKLFSFILALTFTLATCVFAEATEIDNTNVSTDSIAVSEGTIISEDGTIISPPYFPESVPTEEEISPRTIIGKDNRDKVSPYVSPYSAVMFLYIGQDTTGNRVANSWGRGTGFMVANKVMLTAAHCIWNITDGYAESFKVYKNQQGTSLGSTYYSAVDWYVPSEYLADEDYRYDWGVVKLNSNVGSSTGYFGYETSGIMLAKEYTVSGYPGDTGDYNQYAATGRVFFETFKTCSYTTDMMPGQSGAPVFSSDNIVRAINTRQFSTHNRGNKITTECHNKIVEFNS